MDGTALPRAQDRSYRRLGGSHPRPGDGRRAGAARHVQRRPAGGRGGRSGRRSARRLVGGALGAGVGTATGALGTAADPVNGLFGQNGGFGLDGPAPRQGAAPGRPVLRRQRRRRGPRSCCPGGASRCTASRPDPTSIPPTGTRPSTITRSSSTRARGRSCGSSTEARRLACVPIGPGPPKRISCHPSPGGAGMALLARPGRDDERADPVAGTSEGAGKESRAVRRGARGCRERPYRASVSSARRSGTRLDGQVQAPLRFSR